MPIKRLSRDDFEDVANFYYYAMDHGDDREEIKDWVTDINYVFAQIYGYDKVPGRYRAGETGYLLDRKLRKPKTKRKLSAWNKFIKANSNKKKFQYANGKLKLKKMGIAYRKKRR